MNCAIHTQTPATGFCRTCGKALCDDCKRDVMGAIYCEPCIAARLQGPGPAVAQPGPTHMPSPAVAGVLGFLVPGVGAWYNGQFAKGFIHVLIFALLIAATHFSGLFGILIGFFPFYMGFEAYSTAKARQMGLPPPDPLGLERIFGLQESGPMSPGQTGTAAMGAQPASSSSGQPIAAFILIGLGVLFLLQNLGWIGNIGDAFVPSVLIGLGVWIAYKRIMERPKGETR
jgi:TM2 domain-containing membrane protein YozV